MHIEGYAAHFNKANKNLERLDPHAFDETLSEFAKEHLNIPINVDHDANRIIGKVLNMRADDKGLWIEAEIFDELAPEYTELLKRDIFNFMSTEGFVRKGDIIEHKDGTYTCKRFRLTAIAIVNQPADVNARISLNAVATDDLGVYISIDTACKRLQARQLSIYELI